MFGTYRTVSLFAAIIIIGIFVIRPQFQSAQAVQASIDEYTTTLTSIDTYNQRLSDLIKKRDALSEEDRARIDALSGANGINPAQVLYNLEQATLRSGMSLDGVHVYDVQRTSNERASVQGGIQASDFMTQDFELTASGSYTAIKRLLNAIEGSIEPYTVVYLKFANEHEASLMTFTIRVRVYALAAE